MGLGPCLLLSFMVLSLCMPSLRPCSLCSLLCELYPHTWTLTLSGVSVLGTSRALRPHPSLPGMGTAFTTPGHHTSPQGA